MLASPNPSSLAEMEPDHQSTPSTTGLSHYTSKRWNISSAPSAKLLVSNLPTLLFAQASDLHPLFYPFGPIKEVKLLDASMLGNGNTSALVEYADISYAQEAKDALQRQLYGSSYLEVQFIQDSIHPVESSAAYAQSSVLPKTSDARLNPFATPFVLGTCNSPTLASGLSSVAHGSFVNDIYHQPGLPSDILQIPSFATHPAIHHFRPCVADTISRSSSATNSRYVYYLQLDEINFFDLAGATTLDHTGRPAFHSLLSPAETHQHNSHHFSTLDRLTFPQD